MPPVPPGVHTVVGSTIKVIVAVDGLGIDIGSGIGNAQGNTQ